MTEEFEQASSARATTERIRASSERETAQVHQDARRTLSRYYLEEIDRRNRGFLENPDSRPNSGMREGAISHADVNAVIGRAEKTVIFGQQTRLRAGILMKEDEKLTRFHAGHDVVGYFYGAIRLIPDYLLDAVFERGVSVTMVKGCDLLVYRGPRCHQSFHTGRSRKTIYIPEGVLMSAFEKGCHPWAFTEVLLTEAWKLLDYYLVVELARRYQTWMHRHFGLPGFYFVKDTLLAINKHRRIKGEHERTMRKRFRRNSQRGQRRQTKQYDEYDATSTDTEFMKFYRHYYWDFYGWDRPGEENRPSEDLPIGKQAKVRKGDILLRDVYHVGNETFDERRESAWAALKIDALKEAFDYPRDYQVDRDIVHEIAFANARERGQSLEPVSVADLIHDLADAFRFNVARERKAEALMDRLLEAGLPGIVAFYDAVAEEHAMGKAYITAIVDDYDAVEEYKAKIQDLSSIGPEGVPNSIGKDVTDYLGVRLLRQIGDELDGFMQLPKRERIEGRYFLRELTLKALRLARPELDEATREEMVAPPTHDIGPSHHVRKLADVAESVLRRLPENREQELLFDILRKMDLHEGYHEVLLRQARELCDDGELDWGDNRRAVVSDLCSLIPEKAHTVSSDPAGVRARLNRFEYTRRHAPDSEDLIGYLAGVLIRLDRSENFEELVDRLIQVGDDAVPALIETWEGIDAVESHRIRIRDGAARALGTLLTRPTATTGTTK